ncbi:MAG TPA: hypothetical protein VH760_03010 [Gaiellaceae bacterium]
MGLFRRREPLHEQLARQGGLDVDPIAEPRPPGWMETGIHGVPRAREWDAVVTVEAEGVEGETARFVALAGDVLVVEQGEDVEPLADAVDEVARIPYRAEAARRGESQWAVGIRELVVVDLPDDPGGQEVTLTVGDGQRELLVDGAHAFVSLPALERYGETRGPTYVVRARRIDGTAWEVEALPL